MEDLAKQDLKKTIRAEITSLIHDIDQLSEGAKPIPPDRAIGRLTRMEAINSKSINEANIRTARLRVSKLKQALVRLDEDPDFGICERCDRPIPPKRLMLVPESAYCVRCLGG